MRTENWLYTENSIFYFKIYILIIKTILPLAKWSIFKKKCSLAYKNWFSQRKRNNDLKKPFLSVDFLLLLSTGKEECTRATSGGNPNSQCISNALCCVLKTNWLWWLGQLTSCLAASGQWGRYSPSLPHDLRKRIQQWLRHCGTVSDSVTPRREMEAACFLGTNLTASLEAWKSLQAGP